MSNQTKHAPRPGPTNASGFWIDHPDHQAWLKSQAESQFAFFAASKQDRAGFHQLDYYGKPMDSGLQELHSTTRLVHAYALGMSQAHIGAGDIVDQGMAYLASHHRDPVHGGFAWAMEGDTIIDGRKLAYGHVFVLLAAASAKNVGHPNADALLTQISDILDQHFWEETAGLYCDEWNRDWTPFSTYRGMNANMHGIEAMLAAFEATGDSKFLDRAGRVLTFFTGKIAPSENWRIPEHYTQDWQIDRDYAGNHMFRPAGTTPGHSFELGRLLLQHWDLSGRPQTDAPQVARKLIEQALQDAWLPDGGFAYTLNFDGSVADASRFWWPVTEAIGAVAALVLLDRRQEDEIWYRKLWTFAHDHFIDHKCGGWFPAIDAAGAPTQSIFAGKPDIYHSVQACLLPASGRLSRLFNV